MSEPLQQQVLPLIRTRRDLHRWSTANDHGRQMHQAVDILEHAVGTDDPKTVFTVTRKALDAAVRVIAHADDSSGIIGDACRRLLALHPQAAAAAHTPPAALVDWMIDFQFHGVVDYFELDPVAYAPALGDIGMARYRQRLADIANRLGPTPSADADRLVWEQRFTDPQAWEQSSADRVARWALEWNARRLAVHDRDVDAIIATHLRDGTVAAWYTDTAKALAEIGDHDLAIEWAKRGADFGPGHQSVEAAEYWCDLLATHHPEQSVAARRDVFDRWPTSRHATALHRASGEQWPEHRDHVLAALAEQSGGREAVSFALRGLEDVEQAWNVAHELGLDDNYLWDDLAKAYEGIDPTATLPIHTRLVHIQLAEADAANYRRAAKRLAHMRQLTQGGSEAAQVDDLIAELREIHRRRPRLQQEFNRACLP